MLSVKIFQKHTPPLPFPVNYWSFLEVKFHKILLPPPLLKLPFSYIDDQNGGDFSGS